VISITVLCFFYKNRAIRITECNFVGKGRTEKTTVRAGAVVYATSSDLARYFFLIGASFRAAKK
jgi:hypothetical protein